MQPLTAPPRGDYTAAQVTALLTAPDLTVDFGVELLTPSLALVEDISADCAGGVVKRDNLANVHGTLDLAISRELAWGRDRVRPYQLLSSPTVGVSDVRFNEGVFILTTPDRALSETPQTFAVTGYDQLHLLQGCIGDSYAVAAASNVLDAVRALLTFAGVSAPVLLDSSGSAKTLVSPMVWPQTSSENPTWVLVANALLAAIGYRALWCDQNGAFRSSPYLLPSARASEWDLSVGDVVTGIVAEARHVSGDVWGVPNWLTVVRNGLTAAPVNGNGMHVMTNWSVGPSSVDSVGRIVKGPVVYLDAVSQADLEIQGEKLFAAATRVSEVITLKLGPFPCAGHWDQVLYADPALGVARRAQCRSWSLPLDGSSDGDYVLESI